MFKGVMLALLLSISGCSTLDLVDKVNPFKEDKGISATVQLGKENHNDASKQLLKANMDTTNTVKGNQVNAKEKNDVAGNQTITKNTNVPWWTVLLVAFMRPLVVLKDAINLFRKTK